MKTLESVIVCRKDKETTSSIGESKDINGNDVAQGGQNHSESMRKSIRGIKDNGVEVVYSHGNSTGSDIKNKFISKTEFSQFCRKMNRGESGKTVVNK